MNNTASNPSTAFDCIALDLAATSAAGAITELHRNLCAARPVRDGAVLLHDLLARHALGSCCIDKEVALPHARTVGVDDFMIAFGRSANGVRFDDEHPAVRLVILVAAPPTVVEEYLRYTLRIARRLRQPGVRAGLLEAETQDELRAIWASGSKVLA